MALNWENKLKFKDRNGADLKYGDKVLVKDGIDLPLLRLLGLLIILLYWFIV